MARPAKKTIDYFPHQTNHGKTMFIIESRWGNDGYAFWFKLLEVLGSKDGMFIDCNDIPEWEFLLAKTRLSEEVANNILNTLAGLGAINSECWAHRVVFCENLIEGISDAFKRRIEHLPSLKRVIAYINHAKGGNMQTTIGKGKERERKGNNTPPKSPPGDDQVYRTKKGKILKGKQFEMFNQFWAVWNSQHSYPKGKASAADSWLNLKVDDDLFEKIIRGADHESGRRKEILDAGRTAVFPQGWLSGRRWEEFEDQGQTVNKQDKVITANLPSWMEEEGLS